jgi:hypothetical protein
LLFQSTFRSKQHRITQSVEKTMYRKPPYKSRKMQKSNNLWVSQGKWRLIEGTVSICSLLSVFVFSFLVFCSKISFKLHRITQKHA